LGKHQDPELMTCTVDRIYLISESIQVLDGVNLQDRMDGGGVSLEVRKDILGEPVYDVDKRVNVRNSLLKDAKMLSLSPLNVCLIWLTC